MTRKYVFRGTTLGYVGNHSSLTCPVTCTTLNPAKAAAFATYCSTHGNAVVYIAELEKLTALTTIGCNWLGESEEEVAFGVLPSVFYTHCEGYLTLFEILEILSRLGIRVPAVIHQQNLDDVLAAIRTLKEEEIEEFVKAAKSHLK